MDELLSRQVPASAEGEQSVLGSILVDPVCLPEVIELIRAEDFYYPENRALFETISSMFLAGKKVDAVTVLDELRNTGIYDDAGGRNYLLQLMDVTPTAANVREYCDIVRSKSMMRDILAASQEITKFASEGGGGDANDVAELAEQKIYAVRSGREIKGVAHIEEAILDVYKNLSELASNPGGIPGVPTGIGPIDDYLGGLNKSDLVLLASRPGMGKTSMALNIAINAAKSTKKPVIVFQLEMSKEQLAARLISSEALVDAEKLRTGRLNEEEWAAIARASNELAATKLYIDENPSSTVSEMKAKCRRIGSDLALVVVDYLQLMQGSKRSENRVNEISDISRNMKIMAKELNVPVLCLSQLSRAPEQRQDKRPMLSDLRESGAIEQDADIVMFLYREDYYDKDTENRNTAECLIAKNRHGRTGKVDLKWLGQYTRFSAIDKGHSE